MGRSAEKIDLLAVRSDFRYNGPRSDIDLAVVCSVASDSDWQQILCIVEGADTLLKIDLLRLDQLPDSDLKRNIEMDKILL